MKKIIKLREIHLFEQEVLQEYFHEMAKKGWMITKARRMFFVFEKCEPQEISFFFDIYDKGNVLDPNDVDEEQIAYSDFIEEYDYELICRYANYQLFKCKHKPQLPIHTIEDKLIKKKRHQSIIRYELYNFVMLALLFTLNLCITRGISISTLTSNLSLFMRPILYLITFYAWLRCIPFFLWLYKKERYSITVRMYELREQLQVFLYVLFLAYTLFFLCLMNKQSILFPIFAFLFVLAISFYLFDYLFKKKSKKWHTLFAMLLSIYLSLMASVQIFIHPPMLSESVNESSYVQESILLRMEIPADAAYTLYTIKHPLARDLIIDTLLHGRYHSYTYLTDSQGWQVYQSEKDTLYIHGNYIVEGTPTSAVLDSLLEKMEVPAD